MQKIDFVNSTQPALNDTNLNLMQDYIEMAINAQVAGDTLPVGAVLPYAGPTVPENWLLCNGREISRTTYSQLYSIIGTSYGSGDGSTTFNLPNFKGRVPVGYDISQTEFNALGKTGGEKNHTLTLNEMPTHNHAVSTNINCSSFGTNNALARGAGGEIEVKDSSQYINNSGGGQPHNILQPYIVQKYIIKAFQTAGTVAQIVNAHSTSTANAYSASISNGTTLYANSSGTNSTFSLSTSAANYTRLVIHYFETRNNQYSSVEVLSPDGKKIALSNFYAGTDTYLNTAVISISGTSVTWDSNRRLKLEDGTQDTDYTIKITEIIGYKY